MLSTTSAEGAVIGVLTAVNAQRGLGKPGTFASNPVGVLLTHFWGTTPLVVRAGYRFLRMSSEVSGFDFSAPVDGPQTASFSSDLLN